MWFSAVALGWARTDISVLCLMQCYFISLYISALYKQRVLHNTNSIELEQFPPFTFWTIYVFSADNNKNTHSPDLYHLFLCELEVYFLLAVYLVYIDVFSIFSHIHIMKCGNVKLKLNNWLIAFITYVFSLLRYVKIWMIVILYNQLNS